MNEPANRESVFEADSEDEESELGDEDMMNIHSTTKNEIGGEFCQKLWKLCRNFCFAFFPTEGYLFLYSSIGLAAS